MPFLKTILLLWRKLIGRTRGRFPSFTQFSVLFILFLLLLSILKLHSYPNCSLSSCIFILTLRNNSRINWRKWSLTNRLINFIFKFKMTYLSNTTLFRSISIWEILERIVHFLFYKRRRSFRFWEFILN